LQAGFKDHQGEDNDLVKVSFTVSNTEQWDALPDTYNILVGASSQDTRLKGQFKLECELTCKP
jgi:hypothetical protein